MTDWPLSNEADAKLHAAMIVVHGDPQKFFPRAYLERCRHWYDRLSNENKMLVRTAVGRLDGGDKPSALVVSEALPPAPRL